MLAMGGGAAEKSCGQSWASQMVWLLVIAIITRLGTAFDSSHDLETWEEMLVASR